MTYSYRLEQVHKKIIQGTVRFADLRKIAKIQKGSYFWESANEVKDQRSIIDVIKTETFYKINFTRTYIKRQINEIHTIAVLENCGDCIP